MEKTTMQIPQIHWIFSWTRIILCRRKTLMILVFGKLYVQTRLIIKTQRISLTSIFNKSTILVSANSHKHLNSSSWREFPMKAKTVDKWSLQSLGFCRLMKIRKQCGSIYHLWILIVRFMPSSMTLTNILISFPLNIINLRGILPLIASGFFKNY